MLELKYIEEHYRKTGKYAEEDDILPTMDDKCSIALKLIMHELLKLRAYAPNLHGRVENTKKNGVPYLLINVTLGTPLNRTEWPIYQSKLYLRSTDKSFLVTAEGIMIDFFDRHGDQIKADFSELLLAKHDF